MLPATTYWFLAINIVIYISANKVYVMLSYVMLCYVMLCLLYLCDHMDQLSHFIYLMIFNI